MSRLLAAAILAGSCLGLGFGATPAQAASALPAFQGTVSPSITLVEGGCGPGGFRDRFGYCHPRRVFQRYVGCRPGFHPTPYGCRPNY